MRSQQLSEGIDSAIFDAIPGSAAILDASGTIVAVNEPWRRFAAENGGNDSNTVGSSYLNACRNSRGHHALEAPAVAAGIEDVLQGRLDRYVVEYPCPSPTRSRWFMMIVTPIGVDRSGAAPRGALVMHLDISDRKLSDIGRLKRAQHSLRQRADKLIQLARALKRSNEELDHFAYITSHDLRAPLRGIANLSRWIEEDMGDRFTPEGHAQMELLRGRVHRMEALIDAILKYSRIGRASLPVGKVDVRQLVYDIVDLLAPPQGMQIHIADNLPILTTRRVLLEQVLLNLISNAIKYGRRPDGQVWIESRDLGSAYEFVVRDDGPGIAPQFHQKIFIMFQTLSPRDKVEGTGVGLALVKKIVEGQGGTVQVDSAEGRGASFCFTWPKVSSGEVKR